MYVSFFLRLLSSQNLSNINKAVINIMPKVLSIYNICFGVLFIRFFFYFFNSLVCIEKGLCLSSICPLINYETNNDFESLCLCCLCLGLLVCTHTPRIVVVRVSCMLRKSSDLHQQLVCIPIT